MGDFLRVSDRTGSQIIDIVTTAQALAAQFAERRLAPVLAGSRVGVWWDGAGFRNRVAFELGARELGATVVEIPGSVSGGEEIADKARYLDNWLDALIVRTPDLEDLATLAGATGAVVINSRTDRNHPCEILGDLAFVHSRGLRIADPLRLVFVGEATNLLASWIEAAEVLPISITQVCPHGFAAEASAPTGAMAGARPVGEFDVVHTLDDAPIEGADIVYTDCWPRESGVGDPIASLFGPLRVTAAVLDRCRPEALFLPCPPVTRGQEVSTDAMTHPRCQSFPAKDWLLHAQNALLVSSLSAPSPHRADVTVTRHRCDTAPM